MSDLERKEEDRKDVLFEQALAAWTPEMSIRKLMIRLSVSNAYARELAEKVRAHLSESSTQRKGIEA